MEAYVAALCAELDSLAAMAGVPVPAATHGPVLTRAALRPTIFLGGGTPSMLPLPLIEQVLQAAGRLIPLEMAEVTVEANPGTVLGRDYLRELRGMGVNRLSMGVQSLHDPTLRVLGRIHTAAEAYASFEDARRAGFDNVNLDFIFGLPGQTIDQWDATLREVTTWGAEHFSLYSLILEETTPLYAQVISGRVSVPDDDITATMYEQAMERFGASGYVQYEISNWARDGHATDLPGIPMYACHHNLAYWLNADYLACGAGAHGHLFPRRYSDVLAINTYIGQVADSSPLAETIELSQHDLMAETMFMGLRLNVGVNETHFHDRCGMTLDAAYGDVLASLIELGLLERDPAGVRLTARGRMLGNQVFERFV